MANDLVPYTPGQAAAPPPLVDGSGRPLRQAVERLTSEVSGPTMAGVRSIVSSHPAQGLDPARLGQILRAAEMGNAQAYLELAEEMEEKYPHYQSVLGTRKRAVSQLPINVDAAGDKPEEEEDAQLVRDWLKRPTLQSEIFDIQDALGKGFSITEIVWRLTSTAWMPDKLKWRSPTFFEFDQVTGETPLLKGGEDGTSGMPQPLSPCKYITHFAPAKSGLPIRGGLAWTVAWYYLFINFTIKDWITFLEVYGLPLRVGKYQNGTSEGDIRKLAQAVAQIGSDAGCVIPQSMVIDFVQSGASASNPDMFLAFCKYADDQVSKAVLGQTSSADAKSGGLGSGQADLHGDVRNDIRDADAMQLAATLTRDLAMPIVLFNRGPRERYPVIRIGEPDAIDMDAALTGIDAAVKYGLPVGETFLRKVTGVPAPEAGETLLRAPAAQGAQEPPEKRPSGLLVAPKPPKSASRAGEDEIAAGGEIDDRIADPIDRLVDNAIGRLGGLDAKLMGKFDELIAGATSMEEVAEILAIAAGDIILGMDVDQLAELGARAGFATRIAGLVAKPGT